MCLGGVQAGKGCVWVVFKQVKGVFWVVFKQVKGGLNE